MLKISHLCVALEEKPLCKNLSLEIKPGTVHALMGPNGSGKSTLAQTLMGSPAYTVVSGAISFNGEDLLALPPEKRARAGLFLAYQNPPAIPGVQVMTFLKEAHRMLTGMETSVADFKEMVYAACNAVKLDHSFLYRNVHDGFSGGERKRLEVVQLLLFKPKLAILDEIDSGLDIDALMQVTQALNEERKKGELALLIITHYNRILQYIEPDYVHIMSQGTIWDTGDKSLALSIEKHGYTDTDTARPE
jgi:Fe-S cluster assembly ATP-binding protein